MFLKSHLKTDTQFWYYRICYQLAVAAPFCLAPIMSAKYCIFTVYDVCLKAALEFSTSFWCQFSEQFLCGNK